MSHWTCRQCGSSSIGTTKGAYVKGFCRRCYHKNYDRQRTLQNRLRTVTSGSRLQQADSDNPVLVASDSDEESHTLECLRSVDALNENDLEDVLNDIVPTSSCEDVVHLETLFPTPFGCSCPNKRRRHETCAHLEHISVEDDPGRLEVPPLPPPGWTPPGSLTPRSPTQTTPEFYSEEEFGSSEEWTPADCLASIRLKPPFSLCEKGNPWVLSPDDLREISRSVHRSTRQLGSALQGLPVPSCFRFVSWNINGPNRSKTSDLRRTLIRHLLESSGADLAMFQENMWVTKNFVRQLGGDLPLKYSGVPLHAGIARRRRILLRRLTTGGLLEHAHQLVFGVPLGQCHTTVVPLRVRGLTRTGWEEVWNTVLRSKDTPEDRFKTLFRVINRSHCCLYQHTPRKSLLIVSYHNVNKWTVRRDAFVACFWFAHLQTRGLLTDGDTSLIVCGDFNQDIAGMLDEQPLADLHYCLPAYDVTPRRRRKSAIDFVLTRGDVRVRDLSSWDFGVAHAWDPLSTGCRPASPIFGIHESHHLVECPEKAAACGQVFDHDPLVGLLEFL
ncbi:MAG: hypothetical protein KVP17_003377 [Porospora cf. gigantea B]|uniref:uncharacterized protein n=1 Tax=Porospora cf. gigantea B TaxID=2853592 RepID=UPI0035718D8B|nr:MAG: hypothetical protein KVP17_003377 [Porospora cf. gigantea B]